MSLKEKISQLPFRRLCLLLLIPIAIFSIFFFIIPRYSNNLSRTFSQIHYRLNDIRLTTDSTSSYPDLTDHLQSLRQQQDLPSLTSNQSLNQAAQIILYDLLSHQSLTPKIQPEEAVNLYGFDYQTITSFTAILPPHQDLSSFPELDQLVQEHQYTHFGLAQKEDTLDSSSGLVFVIILAQPTTNTPAPTITTTPTYYTGVDLWQEIQLYRRQHGVPEFKQDNTLCTIASIRVNQLLELDKLDDHQGFSPLVEQFRDSGQLTHHNVAENILSGYLTAADAVAGWDSSLGHRSLMQDGSYIYACAAANYGFGVLVAAY